MLAGVFTGLVLLASVALPAQGPVAVAAATLVAAALFNPLRGRVQHAVEPVHISVWLNEPRRNGLRNLVVRCWYVRHHTFGFLMKLIFLTGIVPICGGRDPGW